MLQFGHSLTAVENRKTHHADGRAVTPLQFGHSLTAVENQAGRARNQAHPGASIWPQPYSRGEQTVRKRNEDRARASIWPQPYSRGEPVRGFLTSSVRLASIWPQPYSRGEHTGDTGPAGATGRFNLATALQPWRTWSQSTFRQQYHASIWPQPYSRGEPGDRPRRAVRGRPASIWPQPYSRGEHAGPPCLVGMGRRFNLATALQPWRTRPVDRRTAFATEGFNLATALQPWRTRITPHADLIGGNTMLQFGHSLTAVENA